MTTKNTKNMGHKWKPGESGNPNGRPKGSLKFKSKEFKVACREITQQYGLAQLEKHAKGGNIQAIELCAAYGHGKPMQHVTQTNVNMDYTSWSVKQTEHFIESGEMPVLEADKN